MTVESAESGALSVDQAVESLIAPPEDDTAAPVEAAAEEIEADAPAEETPDDADPADEAEEQEPEEPVEVLEAPKYWSQDAKAKFAALPAELQAVVLEQEGPREAAAAKAKQEAAEVRQAAQQDIQGVRQLAEQLGEFLPRAVETFQKQWGEPDWAAVAREHGADQAFILKTEFEDQQKQIAQLAEARRAADEKVRIDTLREENEKLKGTPLEPVEARQELGKYLAESGYGPSELRDVTARDLLLAHKAMLWDKAQAALKAKPSKPATPAPAKAPARPAAAQPGSSQTRSVAQVANRFAQTRSVDDAVALLLAKR